MMAVQILNSILIFTIDRFMWLLENLCSGGLRASMMQVHVVDENSE